MGYDRTKAHTAHITDVGAGPGEKFIRTSTFTWSNSKRLAKKWKIRPKTRSNRLAKLTLAILR
jgi:hypothetical protein